MATPKSTPAKTRKEAKKTRRQRKRTWNVYVSRSLRSINSQMSMTSRTMKIVNSFVNDLFERIAAEAATIVRVNRKRTLGARELQTAVRLVLPADLAKHAMAEGRRLCHTLPAKHPTSGDLWFATLTLDPSVPLR
ncbi:Core histone H2A/H2B/H3/H4 [Trypanosoma brucei equiperdum]|uniref:Histone H2B n=1 Tax=Trypanosoma brucei equiperdum TaxID=630700 RepID=A0A3L6KZ71_9TRYP|nr:Core histone H2A/H2B/H3/H4 [Trypanosoma brucei equiperdum]